MGKNGNGEQPLISFITPTYNHEKYISKCIQSVLSQSYPHVEQVIIDDGSTDKTGEIARTFCESFPDRITYINQKNRGVGRLAETYASALSACQGDYIAILEGDDWAAPTRAMWHSVAFTSSKNVLSWGTTLRIKEDGSPDGKRPADTGLFAHISRKDMARLMYLGCHISANTVAVRRSALEIIGGFRAGPYYVDYPTWLALLPVGRFHFTPHTISYWGVHGDSYSSLLGPSSRPDRDALSAYDTAPLQCQSLISRKEIVDHWRHVRIRACIASAILDMREKGLVGKSTTTISSAVEAMKIRMGLS